MAEWEKAPIVTAPPADPTGAAAIPAPAAKAAWESAPLVAPTDAQKFTASVPGRVLQGMRDPVDAGAQLLTHILPDSVVDAGNSLNNWLADKTGLVGRIPERNLSSLVTGKTGGIDQMIHDREAEYQAARAATGSTGIDLARIAGNVASPANLAIASRIPVTSTVASRMASMLGGSPAVAATVGRTAAAAGGGAVYGAMAPVTEGDFATEKAKQIGLGAATGPVAQAVGAGVARVISPETRDAVTTLLKQGITPTPGQILGGRWQVLEDKATSIPVLGDAIASARGKSLDELNTAAYARALEPIGGTVPKTVGRDAIADIRQQIGDSYDKLLPKVQFKADNQFSDDIQKLRGMAENLPPDQAARFERVLKNQVIGKMTPQGTMDGQTLKGIEADIGSLAAGLKSDAGFDNRSLGAALSEVQAAVRSNLERANPDYADALRASNTAWANFKRVQNAAAKQGSDNGKFTPAQLQNAVRTLDRSKDKRAFSEGDALMQDLSDPAKDVLASKYPDSGTAGRSLAAVLGAGVVGGAAAPSIGLPAIAGVAAGVSPYLPGGRQAAAALLARRPDIAAPIAEGVRKYAPTLSPALLGLLRR